MAGDLVRFPADQVVRQAASVEEAADAMQTARSAVHDISMDTGAYGQLCQFLPAILSPIFGMGAEALYTTVDSLHETAANLRGTVTSMVGTDVAGGNRIAKAGSGNRPTLELPL